MMIKFVLVHSNTVSRNIILRRDEAIRRGFYYNLAASETGDIRMRRLV